MSEDGLGGIGGVVAGLLTGANPFAESGFVGSKREKQRVDAERA